MFPSGLRWTLWKSYFTPRGSDPQVEKCCFRKPWLTFLALSRGCFLIWKIYPLAFSLHSPVSLWAAHSRPDHTLWCFIQHWKQEAAKGHLPWLQNSQMQSPMYSSSSVTLAVTCPPQCLCVTWDSWGNLSLPGSINSGHPWVPVVCCCHQHRCSSCLLIFEFLIFFFLGLCFSRGRRLPKKWGIVGNVNWSSI